MKQKLIKYKKKKEEEEDILLFISIGIFHYFSPLINHLFVMASSLSPSVTRSNDATPSSMSRLFIYIF